MDAVDEVVLSAMETEVFAPQRLKRLMSRVIDASNAGLEDLEKDIARLQASVGNDKAGLKRLDLAIEKGVVDILDRDFVQQIADARLRIADSENRIRELKDRRMIHSTRISDERVAAFSSQVRERLRKANPAFRRAWLHLFVDRVVIGPTQSASSARNRRWRKVSFRETSSQAPWCPALTVNGAPEIDRRLPSSSLSEQVQRVMPGARARRNGLWSTR
ncbi:MAG: hypothetical protein DI537_40075 [Stutzerimonas stutzeri]|nr:MAG: hypothetical protein DI537_40075 [Stutzerimonas stutzeri]